MKSLKNKFLIPIVSVVALALFITVFTIETISHSLLEKTIHKEMNSKVSILAANVQRYLEDRQKDLKSWGELEICSDFLADSDNAALRNRANRQLHLLAQNFPNYKSANLCGPSGEVLASSTKGKAKFDKLASGGTIVNISKRDYFQSAMKGNLATSGVVISVATGKPGFSVAAPVKKDGIVIGVIYAFVDMKLFSDNFIVPFTVGEKGYAFIANKNHTIIAHRTDSLIMKDTLPQQMAECIKLVGEEIAGIHEVTLDGKELIAANKKLESNGWNVIACASEEEIFKPLRRLKIIGGLILLTAIVVTALVVLFLVKRVMRGISSITDASHRLSLGDLETKIEFSSDDELGIMADAFREMQNNLSAKAELAHTVAEGDLTGTIPVASDKDLLGNSLVTMIENTSSVLYSIQEVSEQVDVGSSQVSALSNDLSDGSIKSAAAIEEISASMEEIKSRSLKNSETAQGVSDLMQEAKKVVSSASNEMTTLESSMGKINSSSLEIGKIIKVIDDIAFQTNLLALNAAVEAARAGVHGKGFAVVADEVRSLAGRSAKAAKETSQLIKDAVDNANEGSDITRNTVEVFSSIEESVQKVATLVQQITQGSTEQAESITQIVAGIQQIEGVIHQNSASSEETAAASQELSAQAQQLKQALSRFKMN